MPFLLGLDLRDCFRFTNLPWCLLFPNIFVFFLSVPFLSVPYLSLHLSLCVGGSLGRFVHRPICRWADISRIFVICLYVSLSVSPFLFPSSLWPLADNFSIPRTGERDTALAQGAWPHRGHALVPRGVAWQRRCPHPAVHRIAAGSRGVLPAARRPLRGLVSAVGRRRELRAGGRLLRRDVRRHAAERVARRLGRPCPRTRCQVSPK